MFNDLWARLGAFDSSLKPCLGYEPFRHKHKVTNSSKMKNGDAEGKYLASLERNTTTRVDPAARTQERLTVSRYHQGKGSGGRPQSSMFIVYSLQGFFYIKS